MRVFLFFISTAFSLLSSVAVEANQGRQEALSENPLVRDEIDVADFPGLATTYGNQVFLSVRENATTGDAGAIIGRSIAFGLWVHRTPKFDDLSTLDELFDSFILPRTHHLVDLLFGMDNGFGIRLSFSAGLESDEFDVLEEDDLVSTGGTSLSLDIHAGYSMDRARYHGDFAAGLTLNYFEVLRLGETAYITSWAPSFLIRHRSVINPRRPIALAVDVSLTRRAYGVVAEGEPGAEGSFARWQATLATGPKLSFPNGLTLWVAGQMLFEQLSGYLVENDALSGDEEQEQPTLTAVGPGLVASAEIMIADVLYVRAGVGYNFYWAETAVPASTFEAARGEQELGQRFHWSAGLGLEFQSFRIDGTLAHQLVFDGPEFVGGRAPGLMGTVSASYSW